MQLGQKGTESALNTKRIIIGVSLVGGLLLVGSLIAWKAGAFSSEPENTQLSTDGSGSKGDKLGGGGKGGEKGGSKADEKKKKNAAVDEKMVFPETSPLASVKIEKRINFTLIRDSLDMASSYLEGECQLDLEGIYTGAFFQDSEAWNTLMKEVSKVETSSGASFVSYVFSASTTYYAQALMDLEDKSRLEDVKLITVRSFQTFLLSQMVILKLLGTLGESVIQSYLADQDLSKIVLELVKVPRNEEFIKRFNDEVSMLITSFELVKFDAEFIAPYKESLKLLFKRTTP